MARRLGVLGPEYDRSYPVHHPAAIVQFVDKRSYVGGALLSLLGGQSVAALCMEDIVPIPAPCAGSPLAGNGRWLGWLLRSRL